VARIKSPDLEKKVVEEFSCQSVLINQIIAVVRRSTASVLAWQHVAAAQFWLLAALRVALASLRNRAACIEPASLEQRFFPNY
jgi:hypothetical protein